MCWAACGGVLWMFMLRFGTTVQQVAKEVPKAAPVQPAPAPAPIQPEAVAAAWPEIIPKIKDLDDALAKLKSPDPRTRIAAVDYIGRQKPPADPARKKMILDALEPLTNDDDVFVRGAASLAKINWGGFDF
jgi:HEAT repeat protein